MNQQRPTRLGIHNYINAISKAHDDGMLNALDNIDDHIKKSGLDTLNEFITEYRENIEKNRQSRLEDFDNFFMRVK